MDVTSQSCHDYSNAANPEEMLEALQARMQILSEQINAHAALQQVTNLNDNHVWPVSKERSSPEQVHQNLNIHCPSGAADLHSSTLNTVPPQNSDSQYPVNYESNRRSLYRCGISYDGSSTGMTVEAFLFQLDSVVQSYGISFDKVFLDLHLVLKDVAQEWYWTYRLYTPSATWDSLRKAFQDRFTVRRTLYETRRIVESRKQLPNEAFMDFYQHMWSLSLQCPIPYGDDEFIQLLMNNMNPVLQYHLTDRRFTHVNELINSCTAWEDSLRRLRSTPDYSMYPRRVLNELNFNCTNDAEPAVPTFNTYCTPSSGNPMSGSWRMGIHGSQITSATRINPKFLRRPTSGGRN